MTLKEERLYLSVLDDASGSGIVSCNDSLERRGNCNKVRIKRKRFTLVFKLLTLFLSH